jgi:hypothetical protein
MFKKAISHQYVRFFGGEIVVEMQIRQSEPEKVSTANIDVAKIIGKVRDFVDNVREISGKPMDVSVGSFNFSVGKMNGEFKLSLNTKIAIKPK